MANKNHLKIENFDVVELVNKFGTPLYIYDSKKLEEDYQRIYEGIKYNPKQIHYAIMCNNRIEILKILLKLDSYIQVNSVKEYLIAKKAGFSNDRISMTTTNISEKDMRFLVENNVLLNLDSIEEIERYGRIIEEFTNKEKNVNNKIGIRIFVHVKATGKYVTNQPYKPKARVGIKKEQFSKVKKIAKKYNLKIIGVHGYLASNMTEIEPFLKLNKYLVDCAKEFSDLEYVNFGAGFGLPTKPKQEKFDWTKYNENVSRLTKEISKYFGRKISLKIEPGRSLAGNCGILLTKATNVKDMGSWKEVGVDSGFGVFARPYIYGWKEGGYHKVIVANKTNTKPSESYTICANSVLQGDYLAEDRKLPKVEVGDLIAFLQTGAYGATMMSLFPGMRKPGEILISKNSIKIIEKAEKI